MAVVDLRHADINLVDGTAITPLEVYLKIGEGTLTFTEARPLIYTTDRGRLDEMMLDTPVPMAVTIDTTWIRIGSRTTEHDADGSTATTTPTVDLVQAALYGDSPYVSVDADADRPHAVDVVITYLTGGGTSTTTITLESFRVESLAFDLSAGTMAITGNCFSTDALMAEAAV